MSESAVIDKSQYEVLETVMADLRRIAESLIMEHCLLSVRLNNVDNELNDVKHLLFENEFKKSNDYHIGPIRTTLYNDVTVIYRKVAQDIGIFDEDLIEVIFVRLQRNIQQHGSTNEYIDECRILNITPKFENLIKQMDLTSLFKYKTS